jgi:hypothetical protein
MIASNVLWALELSDDFFFGFFDDFLDSLPRTEREDGSAAPVVLLSGDAGEAPSGREGNVELLGLCPNGSGTVKSPSGPFSENWTSWPDILCRREAMRSALCKTLTRRTAPDW